MRLFINYIETNKKLELDIIENQTVQDVKNLLEDHFKIDTSVTGLGKKRIVLEYAGCDLSDSWILKDLAIPIGSLLKCMIREVKEPEFIVFIKFRKEKVKIFDTELNPMQSTILELRVYLSNLFGYPLSIFRLIAANTNQVLFDDKILDDYDIYKKEIVLETWQGWDKFLHIAIKGFGNQLIKAMSTDEYIRQYQMRCALYLASHYGNVEVFSTLMTMGVRADQPVGEHPCRQWCKIDFSQLDMSQKQDYLKLEYLKCPVHVAVLSGQLKIINYIAKTCIQVLEQKDGYQLSPWRLALRNQHKDPIKNANQKNVARFLLTKKFVVKIQILGRNVSIQAYANITRWCERAKERVLNRFGTAKSSVKRCPFFQEGLAGNKVLIDGFNNNFKDYSNSYERLRAKYKYYYFKDQEDKDKHGLPDLYFRTVDLVTSNSSSNSQYKKQIVSKLIYPAERPKKMLPLWKKAVNAIIYRKIIKQHYDLLIELGVEINISDFESVQDSLASGAKEEVKEIEKRRNSYNDMKKTSLNLKYAIKQNEKLKMNSSTVSLPKIKADNRNDSKMRAKKAVESRNNVKTNKNDANKKETKGKNFDDAYNLSPLFFEEQYHRTPKCTGIVFLTHDDYRYETMNAFKKYRNNVSSFENAKKIIEDVIFFKQKTWLQQVYLGSMIAKENAKRLLRKYSISNSNQ